jgi:hypothetical protein
MTSFGVRKSCTSHLGQDVRRQPPGLTYLRRDALTYALCLAGGGREAPQASAQGVVNSSHLNEDCLAFCMFIWIDVSF